MLAVIESKIRRGLARLKLYGDLVMFSHSLFALPFGLMGMLLAADGLPAGRTFFWVIVALVGARNAANALNRPGPRTDTCPGGLYPEERFSS